MLLLYTGRKSDCKVKSKNYRADQFLNVKV